MSFQGGALGLGPGGSAGGSSWLQIPRAQRAAGMVKSSALLCLLHPRPAPRSGAVRLQNHQTEGRVALGVGVAPSVIQVSLG